MNHKKRIGKLGFLLIIIFLLTISTQNAFSQGDNVLVHPQVDEAFKYDDEPEVVILLKDNSNLDYSKAKTKSGKRDIYQNRKKINNKIQDKVIARFEKRYKFKAKQSSLLGRWFSGKINKKILDKLKDDPNVLAIVPVLYGSADLQQSVPLINADDVWSRQIDGVNIKGDGQSVCVIDTGVDKDHRALQGKVIAEKCYCSSIPLGRGACCPNGGSIEDNANDDEGHGTHVAGIISATGGIDGVAPETKIVAVKVIDSNRDFTIPNLNKGIEWCIDNADQYNISVISMSLSTDVKYTPPASFWCDFIVSPLIEAYSNDIFVVAATGQSEGVGESGSTTSMGMPACSLYSVAVAASDDSNSFWPDSHRNSVVDLLAPGVDIYSSVPSTGCPGCHPSGYKEKSGTSMAAPHVSGAAALLKQRDPTLKPEQIKNLLQDTGVDIYDSATGLTFKRIDIKAAMDTYYPTIGQGVTREIYEGQSMVFDIEVQNAVGLRIDFKLNWDTGDDLKLSLIGPNNYKVSALNDHPEELSVYMTDSDYMGTWKINVTGVTVSDDYIDFRISTSVRAEEPGSTSGGGGGGSGPGGINFTSANLNYISTCDPSEVTFVMKAEEETGEEIIEEEVIEKAEEPAEEADESAQEDDVEEEIDEDGIKDNDSNKGHGNDKDGCDEDNPGKSRRC